MRGGGGVIPMPPEFIAALKERCGRHGILPVADAGRAGCGEAVRDGEGDLGVRRNVGDPIGLLPR